MTIIIISLLLLTSLLPHQTFTAHVNVGIVNGWEAKPHSRPYMVSLETCGRHNCGGFLISDELVLTAAHCWDGCKLITVVVGAHDLRNSKSSERFKVMSYIPHPEYIGLPDPMRNDIMLLRLDKKVQLNNNVGLMPIPKKKGEDIEAGARCSVAGWGRLSTNGLLSDLLMEANTTIKNPAECERRWGSLFLAPQMICAHGAGGSCFGDSGGPLVCGDTAVGVTSFVARGQCNSPDRPNVYTKISTYLQWIQKEMGNI